MNTDLLMYLAIDQKPLHVESMFLLNLGFFNFTFFSILLTMFNGMQSTPPLSIKISVLGRKSKWLVVSILLCL
jgi:hypothetical protein